MARLRITAASRVGRVRSNNEDMVLVGGAFIRNDATESEVDLDSTNRYLLALADGMGGYSGGEVASQDVLSNLHFFFYDMPTGFGADQFKNAINNWLVSICLTIHSKGKSAPEFKDMGTTLVSMIYYEHEFYWLNCGDSRLYRLHDGRLTQVTTDHSLSALTGSHENSNIITNCIGGGCKSSFIDIMKFTEDVLPGDTFLLCSDGLNDMIADTEIERLMLNGADALTLCNAAEIAGGRDNVSVCLIKVEN